MKESGAFDGLSERDATRVADIVSGLMKWYIVEHRCGPEDERLLEQLHNRSVNSRCKADSIDWDDPRRVGLAFSLARKALLPREPSIWDVIPGGRPF